MAEQTFWNGIRAVARKVTIVVADNGEFPQYWALPYVGQRRKAVEVFYGSTVPFYLDDEPFEEWEDASAGEGPGWLKVTAGHGSPSYGHRSLIAAPGSVEDREETHD